jgi:hypothetical protein
MVSAGFMGPTWRRVTAGWVTSSLVGLLGASGDAESRRLCMRNVCGLPFPLLALLRLASLAGAVILSLAAATAQAVTLSGTIQYSGSHGPVSAAKPIWVTAYDNPALEDRSAITAVTANGGAWALELPQVGDYYLLYWLGVEAEPQVGDPIEVYRDKSIGAGDPLHAPQSGVTLTLNDTWVVPGATGTVTYTGNFPVPSRGINVVSYDDPQLTTNPIFGRANNGGEFAAYIFGSVAYLRFHLEFIGGNDEADFGEPYVIYNDRGSPPGDLVTPGSVLNVTFGDENVPSAVHVTGTVSYSGSRGPVSTSRPILIDVSFDSGPLVGRRTFVANGTPFDIALPAAGSYRLLYALDLDNDGILVGSPNESAAVTAPASGIVLDFNDAARFSGIAGSVTYTGGPGVSGSRSIILEAFDDPGLTARLDDQRIETNGGRYGLLVGSEPRLAYVRLFLDGNYNRTLDPGEPYGVCGAPIQSGPDQTNFTISFGDQGGVATCGAAAPTTFTPTLTRTPTSTISSTPPTPGPCVGDCNSNGKVTVDELVKGVNIALGTAPLGDCPAFNCNGTGRVTVDCLVRGVNAALSGC